MRFGFGSSQILNFEIRLGFGFGQILFSKKDLNSAEPQILNLLDHLDFWTLLNCLSKLLFFIEQQKKRSKILIQGPGVQKNLSIVKLKLSKNKWNVKLVNDFTFEWIKKYFFTLKETVLYKLKVLHTR